LTPDHFKFNNGRILKEIDKLKNQPGVIIRGFDGKNYKVEDYIKMLQGQAYTLSTVGPNVEQSPGIELESIPQSEESKQTFLEQEIASLQGQILEAENNLELIDTYVLELLTGKEFREFRPANNNNKFIKLSEKETTKTFEEEEVLEPVKDYFNDLYEETPGSPNMGDYMTEKYTSKNPKFKIIKK
jgi:TolA-binding protein